MFDESDEVEHTIGPDVVEADPVANGHSDTSFFPDTSSAAQRTPISGSPSEDDKEDDDNSLDDDDDEDDEEDEQGATLTFSIIGAEDETETDPFAGKSQRANMILSPTAPSNTISDLDSWDGSANGAETTRRSYQT